MYENQQISKQQLDQIRRLSDFDLIMLLSEVNDHGWPAAAITLEVIMDCVKAGKIKPLED
jgi:hypothetical protein